MSMTAAFFEEIGRRGGTDDRPFVDANEIAEHLGMNDTDLVAEIEALELGNLIEDITRGGQTEVRLTEMGLTEWHKRHLTF
jgi:DNA-binding MarR family transcriptional regulator